MGACGRSWKVSLQNIPLQHAEPQPELLMSDQAADVRRFSKWSGDDAEVQRGHAGGRGVLTQQRSPVF